MAPLVARRAAEVEATRRADSHRADERDRAIRGFARTLALLRVIRKAAFLSCGWLFIFGAGILIFRATELLPRNQCLWGLTGLLALLPVSFALERRRFPSLASVRALLDARNECGGLLMAEQEVEVHSWAARLPQDVARPKVRWQSGRPLAYLAAACLFALFAFLVPIRYLVPRLAQPLDVGSKVEELKSTVELLKEEAFLEENRAQELQEQIEKLSQEASGDAPVKTWEALDHIAEAMSEAAKKAAEETMAKAESLGKAEGLADALSRVQEGQASPELLAAAVRELGALAESQTLATTLAQKLPPELQEALRAGKLSPEQLKELAKRLGQCKGDALAKLGRLCNAKLMDAKLLEACKKGGMCDSAALAALLCEKGQCMSIGELMACCAGMAGQCDSGLPGRGGISRGRGDAPMTWSDPTSAEGAKFKEEALPPAALADLRESQLVGVTVTAPQTATEPGTAQSGALTAGGAADAHSQLVLPHHRGAVKRYFQRQ